MREDWMGRGLRMAAALAHMGRLVGNELSFRGDVSMRQRMQWWRHGFLSQSGVLYAPFDPAGGEYLSDYARAVQTFEINGRYGRLLDSKLAFGYAMEKIRPGTVPRLLGTIFKGELNLVGDGDRRADPIARLLEQETHIVIKPLEGSHGTGFHVLSRRDDGAVTANGQPASEAELDQLVRDCDAHIVTELIHQASYARAIYPHTTNTVRVLTLRCPDTTEILTPAAVHRIGTSRSVPVDAWRKGGASAAIDLDSGVLTQANWPAGPTGATWLTHHPDSGAPIEGTAVPHWPAVLDGIVGLARQLPFLPYIGWDVVVTDNSFRVLEANRKTDVDLLQVHNPLLRDGRVRRFFEHHGVRTG